MNMEPLDIVKMRAQTATIPVDTHVVRIRSARGETDDHVFMTLDLPNGRIARQCVVTADSAPTVNDSDFEQWDFLGEYSAFLNRKNGNIEALIRNFSGMPLRVAMERLATQHASSPDEEKVKSVDIGSEQDGKAVDTFRVLLTDPSDKLQVEISEADPTLALFESGSPRSYSLKIKLNNVPTVGNALAILKELSTAIFVDLDLTHNVVFGLQITRALASNKRQKSRTSRKKVQPPRLPRLKYSAEAASLYSYGRSATGMPLLEFLAYYQVMEFFFPVYSRQELMQRVRHELLDPRFDPNNDSDLARMLNLLASTGRGGLTESDQLRATISRCVDEESLSHFIKDDPDMEEFLTGKQEIKGVRSINFANRDQKLTDQVAHRLYQIRCRIVHTKEDGGPAGSQMMLPFGEEARKMSTDIELARYVAQKVLIAGGRAASWG
ncbi:hypothetical protein [Actinoplanes sp. NPDC051859]|uniref:hypothetical protein n=1 Tax=Actinoplanes sp. NPDC051859 TaxID=3363909 RepID=UPI0037A5753A